MSAMNDDDFCIPNNETTSAAGEVLEWIGDLGWNSVQVSWDGVETELRTFCETISTLMVSSGKLCEDSIVDEREGAWEAASSLSDWVSFVSWGTLSVFGGGELFVLVGLGCCSIKCWRGGLLLWWREQQKSQVGA